MNNDTDERLGTLAPKTKTKTVEVPHISPDLPISASTYQRQKCRCPGCKAAASEQMARTRAKKAGRTRLTQLSHQRASTAAVRWIRQNDPELWSQMLEEARKQVASSNPELDVDLRKAASA